MQHKWAEWLTAYAARNRGGWDFPAIDRGMPYSETFQVQGDVSGDTFLGEIRAAPDAEGAALATFTITPGAYADGVTLVTWTIAEDDYAGIPDTEGKGVVDLITSAIHFPLGGTEYVMFGCSLSILGAVTDDDA